MLPPVTIPLLPFIFEYHMSFLNRAASLVEGQSGETANTKCTLAYFVDNIISRYYCCEF